jgi:hypothetical protein
MAHKAENIYYLAFSRKSLWLGHLDEWCQSLKHGTKEEKQM